MLNLERSIIKNLLEEVWDFPGFNIPPEIYNLLL
jgi:hypothetical protein